MINDSIFVHRETACVVVRLADVDRAEWNTLATNFVTSAGTRGALLKRRTRAAGATSMHLFPRLRTAYGAVTLEGLRALQENSLVEDIGLSGSVALVQPELADDVQFTPVAPAKGPAAGLVYLDIPSLWEHGYSGAGVKIGLVDSTVDPDHPALRQAIAKTVLIDDVGRAKPYSRTSPPTAHGTHTAGIIGAREHNGAKAGAAPGAALYCAAVNDRGDSVTRLLGAITWALQQRPKVLNLSLGQSGYNDSFRHIIADIRRGGCLPVCATGNLYEGFTMSPANYEDALSVGALGADLRVAPFSGSERMSRANDPNVPDMIAPGVDVTSAVPGGRFAQASGTSQAAPHIAGLAALLLEACPRATVDQLEQALFDACSLTRFLKQHRAGRGVPNALAALHRLSAVVR